MSVRSKPNREVEAPAEPERDESDLPKRNERSRSPSTSPIRGMVFVPSGTLDSGTPFQRWDTCPRPKAATRIGLRPRQAGIESRQHSGRGDRNPAAVRATRNRASSRKAVRVRGPDRGPAEAGASARRPPHAVASVQSLPRRTRPHRTHPRCSRWARLRNSQRVARTDSHRTPSRTQDDERPPSNEVAWMIKLTIGRYRRDG